MRPVSRAFTCTVAPETTAPLASVTIPEIPASTLACNGAVAPTTTIITTINPSQACLASSPQISTSTAARIPHGSRQFVFMVPPTPIACVIFGNRQNVYNLRLYQRLIDQVKKKVRLAQPRTGLLAQIYPHNITGMLTRPPTMPGIEAVCGPGGD